MVRTRSVVALLILLVSVSTVSGAITYLALTVDEETTEPQPGLDDATLATEDAIAELHEAGVSGDGVSVGILDVTGFEIDDERLSDRVVETQSFGDADVNGGDSHGTSTAVAVARIAPDAELYLGTFETADDYAAGLEWMERRGVDVVVAPVAYAGTPGDGSSRLARATTEATQRGLVVVAPAGNLGTGHWSGQYAPTDDGVHTFDEGSLNEVAGPPGRAEFWLAWDDDAEEYELQLHRIEGDETELLVRSVPYDDGDVPGERLTVQLDEDRYALVVRGPTNATDTRIRVTSTTHSLSDVRPSGSVTAPAAAPGAISVGAFDPATGELEPFSSRGPTADGRLGVYVVGPSSQPAAGESFVGTSASAAFVGGVVALVLDVSPELDPAEVRWAIASSAEPIDGIDVESGHGRIDPEGAVAEAARRGDGDERDAIDREESSQT